ncbi:MAG TPA: hypothetical protein C5S51_06180 [Methanosarcinaceae archaeon]|nr:hypothetical protein [Methanosarcinaceae archaeon]
MGEMDIIVFLKKFILYLTVLYILWIPIAGKYFSYSVVAVDATNFFLFYLPLTMIPFVALVLATPIEKSRMIKFIFFGLVLTIGFNLSIVILQILFSTFQTDLLYLYAIGRIAFPFLLWVAFTHETIFVFRDE